MTAVCKPACAEEVAELRERVARLEAAVIELQTPDDMTAPLRFDDPLDQKQLFYLALPEIEEIRHRGAEDATSGEPPQEPWAAYLEGWCDAMAEHDWTRCECGHAICEHDPSGVCCHGPCDCRRS